VRRKELFSIIIKNFEFETIIGVLDFERVTPQKVVVNCEIFYEYNGKYLDYAEVSNIIKDIIQHKEFEIIEDSLGYISDFLKNEYLNITKIDLEILKPDILENMVVGAKILKVY
jgi:dihydroneopterin aldolase